MLEAYSHSPVAMVDQIDQPVGSGTKKRPADESERVVGNVNFCIVTYKKCCPNPTNVYPDGSRPRQSRYPHCKLLTHDPPFSRGGPWSLDATILALLLPTIFFKLRVLVIIRQL